MLTCPATPCPASTMFHCFGNILLLIIMKIYLHFSMTAKCLQSKYKYIYQNYSWFLFSLSPHPLTPISHTHTHLCIIMLKYFSSVFRLSSKKSLQIPITRDTRLTYLLTNSNTKVLFFSPFQFPTATNVMNMPQGLHCRRMIKVIHSLNAKQTLQLYHFTGVW